MTKLRQLTVAPWEDDRGRLTYSLYALGVDGNVYRLQPSTNRWQCMGTGPYRSHRRAEQEADTQPIDAS